jgi:hypothetical protein
MEQVIYYTAGCHKTGIDGSTDYTSKGVPCCWVKPVPKFLENATCETLIREPEHCAHIEALRGENLCCSTVKEALSTRIDKRNLHTS